MGEQSGAGYEWFRREVVIMIETKQQENNIQGEDQELDNEKDTREIEIEIEDGTAEEENASEEGNTSAEAADEERESVKDGETAGESGETAGDGEAAGAEGTEKTGEAEEAEKTAEEDKSKDSKGKSSKEKGKRFKKKKDKKDEKIEELTDQVKRQMAEFENFRRRSEKEKSQMFDMGAKNVIEKMLNVVDNFERGLAAVPEEQKEDPFVSGMDMIYKQIMTELDNLGVKPIECLGKEFDPEFHNAVTQMESEEYDSGVVAKELQKGYMYKDSVVRHSMVAVVP